MNDLIVISMVIHKYLVGDGSVEAMLSHTVLDKKSGQYKTKYFTVEGYVDYSKCKLGEVKVTYYPSEIKTTPQKELITACLDYERDAKRYLLIEHYSPSDYAYYDEAKEEAIRYALG